MRRVWSKLLLGIGVAWLCVAPADHARALPPAPSAEMAAPAEVGDDEAGGLTDLAVIEGTIIGGLMSLITTALLLWIRADRKRTDDTMKADREQVQKMTSELIASLREQAAIYKEADQANREGLAQVVKSISRVDDDVRALRQDLGALDERVTVLENASPAASTTRGRRAKDS